GNNRLAKIARALARAEQAAAVLALTVLGDGPPVATDLAAVEIVYPVEFDLYTASEVAGATADFQAIAARAGTLPATEGLMLSRLMRLCLPGLSDAQYARCEAEIRDLLGKRVEARESGDEAGIGTPERPYSADVHRW